MAPAWDSKGCPYLGSPLRIVHLLCATRTAQRAVGALPIHTSALKHASQPAARAKRGARSHLLRPSPCRNVRPDPRRPLSRGQITVLNYLGEKIPALGGWAEVLQKQRPPGGGPVVANSRFAIQACRSALRGDWLRCSLVAKFRHRSFPHPS